MPQLPGAVGTARQLAAFIAAGQADSQLRHAAALVNGDIGATSMRFTRPPWPRSVRSVTRGSPAPDPAGLYPDLRGPGRLRRPGVARRRIDAVRRSPGDELLPIHARRRPGRARLPAPWAPARQATWPRCARSRSKFRR